MTELNILEEHPDFVSVSRRARELAMQFQESTSVQRCSAGWAVLVSPSILSALPLTADQPIDTNENSSDPYDDEYQSEVVEQLIEEFQSDQDEWARSEEDGWYYED